MKLQTLTLFPRGKFSVHAFHDIPKRFDSEQLAKKLSLSWSTVAEHLRKAEQRLIGEAFTV
ncbi:hypothetical protein AUG19_05545 [archaeon 13_1_20CM_2_54_9]|nr:MAG: hypothetical protein AUG19_05545 [archaeon 13_1_20CM_2_54_9]